jgi:large subunit ribosomal protein L25
VQMHPFKQLVQHIDFQRVTADTKLHMKVPLHFTGAEESPAIKVDHCVANYIFTELDVSCLPRDLPEFISVDLSGLKKGTSLHLKDITLPKGVKAVTHGNNNPAIVSAVLVAAAASDDAADAATAATAAAASAPAAKK